MEFVYQVIISRYQYVLQVNGIGMQKIIVNGIRIKIDYGVLIMGYEYVWEYDGWRDVLGYCTSLLLTV